MSTPPTAEVSTYQPRIWVSGDWNALFGFGTNILVNVLVLTGLLRFALQMPDDLVFGRILPATGLMLFLSTTYYAYLAWKLSHQQQRNDVCALPSGVGVAHMFIVVFVIMMPIQNLTGDPYRAWEAGLAWVFIQSIILMSGGVLAPIVRKVTPRAALLGTLAGVSVAFISLRPALEMYLSPTIGLLSFALIMVSWFGSVRLPAGLPAGLLALLAGTGIAWLGYFLGADTAGVSPEGVTASFLNFGFSVPLPAISHTFSGFEYLGILLVTAIPFGIYDLVEATDNVESAAAAGDSYPTSRVVVADGVVSMIGALMGNPFINAVYIGHPGWKAMGGRIGYSVATGFVVLLLTWLGLVSLALAIIPVVALLPILLYIGMLIGAQAFRESPIAHAPAIILALVPHLAAWGKTQIDNALSAAGTSAAEVGMQRLADAGLLYEGLKLLGEGAILSGLVLGAMAVFVIEKQFVNAAMAGFVAAILSFFGFMHSEAVGLGVGVEIAVAYVLMALVFFGAGWLTKHESPILPGNTG